MQINPNTNALKPLNGNKHCNLCGVHTNQNQVVCIKCGCRLGQKGGVKEEWYNDDTKLLIAFLLFWPLGIYGYLQRNKK